jgi:RNA polymerase sigma-70 factor (ECF subfamily)
MSRLSVMALDPPKESQVSDSASSPGPDVNEGWVIQRVKQGDREAFRILYRHYVGKVYAICLRITANQAIAEELTQEVFLKVWERIGQYEGRSKFSTWLHRIATNRALDGLRSEIRRSSHETSTEEPGTWEPPQPVPRPDRRLDLDNAIAGLPPSARAIFVLHDVEGYRHEEIAEMIGIAAGTSKSQLHRARRLLRERLRS